MYDYIIIFIINLLYMLSGALQMIAYFITSTSVTITRSGPGHQWWDRVGLLQNIMHAKSQTYYINLEVCYPTGKYKGYVKQELNNNRKNQLIIII
jgi:hypothetical protein